MSFSATTLTGSKPEQYARLLAQARALLHGERDRIANAANLFAVPIGTTGGDAVTFDLVGRGGPQSASIADLRKAHEGFFPALMQGEL